ncbi:MAG: DUF6734 family protein, partial [Verrucomicrobiota bacterium]
YDRSLGGWLRLDYFWMSWTLSCLKLKSLYDQVELFTDESGAELLIDKLNLPYTKVTIALNEVDHYHEDLWAVGKLYTYGLQNEPFLHVDGDIFLWSRFDFPIVDAPFVTQSLDDNLSFYHPILNQVEEHFSYTPKYIKQQRDKSDKILACNAGIFGGSNLEFIQAFAKEAFKFIHENTSALSRINVGYFNCIYEQYLSYCMAIDSGIEPTFALDYIPHNEGNIASLIGVPAKTAYVHPTNLAKKDHKICDQIEIRLKMEYPEWYETVRNLTEEYSKTVFATSQSTATFSNNLAWLRKRYQRTIQLIQSLDIDSFNEFLNTPAEDLRKEFLRWSQSVSKSLGKEYSIKLNDALRLEVSIDNLKRAYSMGRPDDQSNEKEDYQNRQNLFNVPDEKFLDQTLLMNDEIKVLKTKFNWSGNVNLPMVEGGFWVALVVRPDHQVREIWCGQEIKIIDYFKQPNTAKKILKQISRDISNHKFSRKEFDQVIVRGIKEFIAAYILNITETEEQFSNPLTLSNNL